MRPTPLETSGDSQTSAIPRSSTVIALEAQRWVATLNRECQNHISTFADDLTYLILDEKENDK